MGVIDHPDIQSWEPFSPNKFENYVCGVGHDFTLAYIPKTIHTTNLINNVAARLEKLSSTDCYLNCLYQVYAQIVIL